MNWRINTPRVVAEQIDDETILIHLERGHYFSLRGSAPQMFNLIASGASQERIVSSLAGQYPDVDSEQMAAELARLVEDLQANELIVTTTDSMADLPPPPPAKTFQPPLFEKFTDLQDLILLDPIHEVGPEGWPEPKN